MKKVLLGSAMLLLASAAIQADYYPNRNSQNPNYNQNYNGQPQYNSSSQYSDDQDQGMWQQGSYDSSGSSYNQPINQPNYNTSSNQYGQPQNYNTGGTSQYNGQLQ